MKKNNPLNMDYSFFIDFFKKILYNYYRKKEKDFKYIGP